MALSAGVMHSLWIPPSACNQMQTDIKTNKESKQESLTCNQHRVKQLWIHHRDPLPPTPTYHCDVIVLEHRDWLDQLHWLLLSFAHMPWSLSLWAKIWLTPCHYSTLLCRPSQTHSLSWHVFPRSLSHSFVILFLIHSLSPCTVLTDYFLQFVSFGSIIACQSLSCFNTHGHIVF